MDRAYGRQKQRQEEEEEEGKELKRDMMEGLVVDDENDIGLSKSAVIEKTNKNMDKKTKTR